MKITNSDIKVRALRRTSLCSAALVALAGCNQSTDARFAQFCKEATAAGEYQEQTAEVCKADNHLTDGEKERLVGLWQTMRDAQATVQATEEEGKRKGYNP